MSVIAPPDANSPFLDSQGKLIDRSRTWTNEVTRRVSNQRWTDVTFENSWVNFGSTFNDAQFRLVGVERVELRGVVKTGTVGVAIFTLPVDLRPLSEYVFPVISNNLLGRIDVMPDGEVNLNFGSNVFATLDGIIFSLD